MTGPFTFERGIPAETWATDRNGILAAFLDEATATAALAGRTGLPRVDAALYDAAGQPATVDVVDVRLTATWAGAPPT